MELTITAKLENVFKAKDFINKDTGEIESRGKWQLQFIEKVEGDEGEQLVVHKVSVPDQKVTDYKDKVGEVVSIPVGTFAQKGKVIFYGV